jgi:iron complex outermembrane receptor protein
MRKIIKRIPVFTFHRWTRKKYAVFNSLQKVIRIGILAVTYSILVLPVKSQSQENGDTTRLKNLELEEIVITAGRTPSGLQQVTRMVTLVNHPEIERAPSINLNDLLRHIPSVDIRQRGPLGSQADISIRGGTYDQALILLNGINLTDPQSGHHNLNLPVEPGSIERIEVLHGTDASANGINAFSGAINIITGNSRPGHIHSSIVAGQYGLFKGTLNLSDTLKRFSHFLSAGHTSSNGYTHNTDFSNTTLFYQAKFRSRMGTAGFQTGYQIKEFGANGFYSILYPDQFEAIRSSFFSLRFETLTRLKISEAIYLRRSYDRFELIRDISRVPFNHHRTTTAGMNLNLQFIYSSGKVSWGMDLRNENIVSNVLGNALHHAVKVPGYDSVFYSKSYNRLNSSMFAGHLLTWRKLNLNTGILIHHNTGISSVRFYPSMEASYRISGNLTFFSSANKVLRIPTFTDMFYKSPVQQGCSGLKPEEATAAEGGFNFVSPAWEGRISAFHRREINLIDWVKSPSPDSLVWRSRNHTGNRMTGAECSLYFFPCRDRPGGWIETVRVSYTFINGSPAEADLLSRYANDYLKHHITASADFRITKKIVSSMRLAWRDRNGTYQDAAGKVLPYKPYWLCDARISLKTKYLTIFTSASNLLNARYFDFGGLVQPGTWIHAGIEVDWDFRDIRKLSVRDI